MKVKVDSLVWSPAGTEIVERNVGEKAPRGVIKILGQNNKKVSYLVPTKATLMLTVKDDEGNVYKEDVYGILKYYNQKIRVTINLRKRLEEHLKGYPLEVDGRFFTNLYKCIKEFFYVE